MSESRPSSEEDADEQAAGGGNVEFETTGGVFSYIRLGRPRTCDSTSTPTIDNPTGHYVWDFLNWGLTSPYGQEEFSKVTPSGTEIVPFSDMDQGKLFVRVSVQDLATLQLAYRGGLSALKKAQNKVEQLRDENLKLQSMVKGWSIKTTELTTETITLKQEITNLKHKMRATHDVEHRDFITFLCRSICQLFEHSPAPHNTGPTFNYLLKLIFSLPIRLQERLSNSCPKFKQLINSRNPAFLTQMHTNDVRVSIQNILRSLTLETEYMVIEQIVTDFNKRQEFSMSLSGQDIMASSTKSLPVPKNKDDVTGSHRLLKGKRSNLTLSLDDNSPLLEEPKSPNELLQPELPPRNYTQEDLVNDPKELKEKQVLQNNLNKTDSDEMKGAAALDRLDKLVINEKEKRLSATSACSNNNTKSGRNSASFTTTEPVYAEVTIKNRQQKPNDERESKSKSTHSSSIGTPLAQSTPFGTWSTLISPKHQINPPSTKRKRKRKVSRWNFAARLCSSGRSATMSDSESMESSIYHQTARPNMQVRRHHGMPASKLKGYKWFFKSKKR